MKQDKFCFALQCTVHYYVQYRDKKCRTSMLLTSDLALEKPFTYHACHTMKLEGVSEVTLHLTVFAAAKPGDRLSMCAILTSQAPFLVCIASMAYSHYDHITNNVYVKITVESIVIVIGIITTTYTIITVI